VDRLALEALIHMEPNLPTILIVEDHCATRRFLADNLVADGFRALEAESAAAGLSALADGAPELAIIDLGLPDRDGLDLLRELRESRERGGVLDCDLPVLILSGRAAQTDRIRCFERGCDDFLAKPFSYAELRGRVVALLRRAGVRARQGRVRIGTLELDPVAHDVWVDGEPVYLAKKEYSLLRVLATEPTRVFTRDELLREVWGFRSMCATRTLDSHASRLRQKLRGGRQRFVVNVWGVGYRLTEGDTTW
jgi:DNA-binding response OmpR family regulator